MLLDIIQKASYMRKTRIMMPVQPAHLKLLWMIIPYLQEQFLTELFLKSSTRDEMFKPQIRLRSIKQFGPLSFRDTTANDAIGLSYGLGWGILQSPHGIAAFKEGHGDGFQHYTIIFPEKGTGIIILSNSDNAESIFKELLEITIADTYTPWYWQNYIPYDFKKQVVCIVNKITDYFI